MFLTFKMYTKNFFKFLLVNPARTILSKIRSFYLTRLFSMRTVASAGNGSLVQPEEKYDLFVMLDTHILQHRRVNITMLRYHRAAFPEKKILLLNAPTTLVFENDIYGNKLDFNYNYILKKSSEVEAVGFLNYNNIEGVSIYSLVSDTDKNFSYDVFQRISSVPDEELDSYLAIDPIIQKLVWVDLSLVLKSSKRNFNNIEQNYIIRILIFHYELIKNFLDIRGKDFEYILNNSIYSINQAAVEYFRKNFRSGGDRYLLHLHEGYDVTRFKVLQHPSKDNFFRRRLFQNYNREKLMQHAFEFAKSFLDANVFGNSAFKYSPEVPELAGLTCSSILGLSPNKPIFVYFSSSPDEELVSDIMSEGLYANGTVARKPYSNEVVAIRDLADRARTLGAYLVVRFHPRLDVESRVPRRSDQYQAFLEAVEELSKDFPNVIIIQANQNISSYWLAGWATHIFSVRSSMGNVLPLLGLPVSLMSDNRGSSVAGFEALTMTHVLKPHDEMKISNIDREKLINFILGFYVTNCHASFIDSELDERDVLNLYKSSIDIGYSSLAFVSDASADLYEGSIADETSALLDEYIIYLIKRLEKISHRDDFPHTLICKTLLNDISVDN